MKRRTRAALGTAVLAALGATGAASGTAQPAPGRTLFGLVVHVADDGDHPAADEAWVGARVQIANGLFAAYGVGFEVRSTVALEAAHARLETRADRHALGALLDPSRIDVFVVLSLRDVDDPSLYRRGVHWRPAGRPGAHFVVLSIAGDASVLAHELGHYFGNPHSTVTGNIMSYDRGQVPPFFDAAQGRRIAAHARRFAREGHPAALTEP